MTLECRHEKILERLCHTWVGISFERNTPGHSNEWAGSLCSSELVKEQTIVWVEGKIGRENLSNLLFFVAVHVWLGSVY